MPTDDLATLVDENDAVIGSKPRREITPTDIYRVAALWLTNSQGEILLAQRVYTKRNNPGKWGPAAAGTVEPGETYEENMYREAKEELGLTGIHFQLGPKTFTNDAGQRRHFTQWFIAQIDQSLERFTAASDEVAAIAWVASDQLRAELQDNPDKYIPGTHERWGELFL